MKWGNVLNTLVKLIKKDLYVLTEIAKLKPTSLAFPYNIGCGLAGGDLDKYYPTLQEFSIQNSEIKISLYNSIINSPTII